MLDWILIYTLLISLFCILFVLVFSLACSSKQNKIAGSNCPKSFVICCFLNSSVSRVTTYFEFCLYLANRTFVVEVSVKCGVWIVQNRTPQIVWPLLSPQLTNYCNYCALRLQTADRRNSDTCFEVPPVGSAFRNITKTVIATGFLGAVAAFLTAVININP